MDNRSVKRPELINLIDLCRSMRFHIASIRDTKEYHMKKYKKLRVELDYIFEILDSCENEFYHILKDKNLQLWQ